MWRKLYFSFSTPDLARQVVAELERVGLKRSAMHSMAKSGIDLTGLPVALDKQQSDPFWFWDRVLWQGAQLTFAVLMLLLLFSLAMDAVVTALTLVVVTIAVFLMGAYLAILIPRIHLNRMERPLAHGEVVLLIDARSEQVAEITRWVEHHHPGAGLSGMGWMPNFAG